MTASTSGYDEVPPAREGRASASPRRLYRSRRNRTLAGVCGGIAEYYGADPGAVRLLTIVIALFTAVVPVVVLYLVAAVIVPEQVDGEEGTEPVPVGAGVGGGQGSLVFGGLLVVVGFVALANEIFRVDWDVLWPIILVGLGAMILLTARRR